MLSAQPAPASSPPTIQFRMVDWAHLKSEFIWAYEGAVENPRSDSREHHPGQSALLLVRGSLRVETEAGVLEAAEGHWVFPSRGPRLQRFSEGAVVLSVHFELNWAGGRPLYEWPVGITMAAEAHPLLAVKARALIRGVSREIPKGATAKSAPWQAVEMGAYFRVQPVFAHWLGAWVDALSREGYPPARLAGIDPRILLAANILDDRPLSEVITERELAQKVGLSLTHLNRLFISQFGTTPRSYLERKRITRARELLENSPLSIKQIAFELAFGSLPAFSRWFQKNVGVSPRAFRKG